MWRDLMKPVEPVVKRFMIGKTKLHAESGLEIEIRSVSPRNLSFTMGGYDDIHCLITKNSAKELSDMFKAIYEQLEE